MPNRTAPQNHIVLVAFLTVVVTIVAAVGPVEGMLNFFRLILMLKLFFKAPKKKKKSGYPPLSFIFNDHSSHTNIHDSYNARNRHTTNSNNDSSARYSKQECHKQLEEFINHFN